MPDSFEVREIAEQPIHTMGKQRTWGGIALRIGLGVLFFVIGISCGWYLHVTRLYQQQKEAYVVPDIAVELEAGIDDVIALFPESADAIQAQRGDIVKYMLNMTDPPEDSLLQTTALLGDLEDDTDAKESRKLAQGEVGVTVSDNDLERCMSAVGDLVHEFMSFVTGFVRLAIPASAKFKNRMIRWFRRRYTEFQIAKMVNVLVYSENVRDKVEAMFMFFIKARHSDGGVMKALYDWMVQELTPWKAVKAVVKLAVVSYGWLKAGFRRFFGDLSFFEENFKRMLKAGGNVIKACNNTISFEISVDIGGDKGRFLLA